MARKIGIGVVGAGGIAGIEHIPNFLRLKPQFEVAGVCDPSATARGFVTGHPAFAGGAPLSLRVLAEADYSSWLVVEAEQDPRKTHPLTYARMGFENLSRLAKAAGFTVDN